MFRNVEINLFFCTIWPSFVLPHHSPFHRVDAPFTGTIISCRQFQPRASYTLFLCLQLQVRTVLLFCYLNCSGCHILFLLLCVTIFCWSDTNLFSVISDYIIFVSLVHAWATALAAQLLSLFFLTVLFCFSGTLHLSISRSSLLSCSRLHTSPSDQIFRHVERHSWRSNNHESRQSTPLVATWWH